MKTAMLCLLAAAILGLAEAAVYTPSDAETLRNVLLTQAGSVIVGSNTSLRRLNLNLEVLQTLELPDGQVNRLLSGDPGGTYNGSFMSCTRMNCKLLDAENISSQRWEDGTVLRDGSLNARGLFVPGPEGISVFTAALPNEVQVSRASSILRGYLRNVDSDSQYFDEYAEQKESKDFRPRAFLSVFKHEEFSYYINRLTLVTNMDGFEMFEDHIRLVRLCNNDTGRDDLFASYFEIQLECGGSDNLLSAATFIPGTATVVVSVSSSSENHVCLYNLSEIRDLMTAKYEECGDGDGHAGLARERDNLQSRCGVVQRINDPDVNECHLISSLRPSQEVATPLSAVPVLSQPLSEGQFSSLLHTTVDGFQFIFAGTVNGKLYWYHVKGTDSVPLIRTFNLVDSLEVGVANITQLMVTSDGLTLYALTPFKLISHSVDVCGTYKSCDACVASRDPLCGWCSLENRCSRQVDCNSGSAVWVYGDTKSCPVISNVDRSIIYIRELKTGVSLTLNTSNIPDDGQDYECSYRFLSNTSQQQSAATIVMDTMGSMATRNGNMFTCDVPRNIPGIPNMEDALLSNLSLRYSGNDVATLDPPIRFANCSVHTTCTSCIETESQCKWCPFTFKCIASRGEMCAGSETAVATSCPKLLPPDIKSNNYLLHTSYLYEENPLIIKAENLEPFSELFSNRKFECVIRSGGVELFRTDAVLAGSRVECQWQQFDYKYADGEARLHATLDVEWTTNNLNIDNPNNTGVTLYSCPRLGSNCAQCLSVAADYNCSYCTFSCLLGARCRSEGRNMIIVEPAHCSAPTITSISPNSGPLEGGTMVTVVGTDLGTARSDIPWQGVKIDGVSCDIVNHTYQPGVSFTCVTGGVAKSGSYPVSINFTYLPDLVVSPETAVFTFKTPSISSAVSPTMGPQSGGTMVTITGSNLDVGSSLSVSLVNENCDIITTDEGAVTCSSSASDEIKKGVVRVAIDNWEGVTGDNAYRYEEDPTLDGIMPRLSFESGGTEYTISGSNLHIVQEPRLLVHITTSKKRQVESIYRSEPCTAGVMGTTLSCFAPAVPLGLTSSQSTATIGLEMDGVSALRRIENQTVVVYSDPRFKIFGDLSFSSSEEIRLTVQSEGSEFVFMATMVRVLITPCGREACACVEVTFQDTNTSFTCIVESTSGLSRGRDLTVTVHVGNFSQNIGRIKVDTPPNLVVVIVVPIAVLFVVGLVVFAVVVLIFCYNARLKDSRYNQLIVEMEKLESSVARECKLGFAELQTDLDELAGDVSGHRLPYHDLKVYLLTSLFPGSKDHPVLREVQLPLHRQISSQRAIKDFHDLCMDKKVLLTFIRTLESQRSFTIRDKSLVGSLLMVTLHPRLDYATEILKSLMSDLIHHAISKSSTKLLLRRTDSVAEKMLTNWLAFCLHGYIVEHAGKPLYLLYRAVKSQLEKGPIDVITGEARYCLSEHKLIRQKMDGEVLTVTVEADDGLRVPVKVLDCDTISQVKEKLLDSIYKATPVSKRPSLTSIDLEYVKSPRDYMVLRDEDTSTASEAGWKRLNTLQHYGVVDGAVFRLMKRNSHAPPGRSFDYPASLISSHAVRSRALSEAEDGTRVWHLFKQHDMEDPRRSPFMNKKMITEVYLPRMLSTKNILQKFVDDLFSSLFSVSQSPTSPVAYSQFFPQSPGTQAPNSYAPGATVPMAVKYILDFLDDAAESAQITERDVVHTWKNNALALRFWVNMMKNPEFVFDINKSHTVDACLSVIAQAIIDGCSFTDVKLTMDSPTSKLLYNKEVRGYKAKVRQYYQNVARLPRIPEDAMQSYLKQLSEHQAQVFRKNGGFVVESALYELLRYGNKYHEQLLANLRAAGLESRAQVFESVVRATR